MPESRGEVPALAIGSVTWPGLAKLAEESGELLQVIGKIAAFPGGGHPDGTDVVERLHDELADVAAAVEFVIGANDLDRVAFNRRATAKLERFRGWHAEHQPAGALTSGTRAA